MLRSTHRRSAGGAEQVQGGTSVNADTVQRWLEQAAASLREQRDYLTQLDAAIGDADHGTNMDRGFTAVVAKLEETDGPVSPGRLLITSGGTLVSTVGGASGPLWGTALRRAGRALGASGGVAIGRALVWHDEEPAAAAVGDPLAALDAVAAELARGAERFRGAGLADEAEILETNKLMVEDPALRLEVERLRAELGPVAALREAT